MKTKLSTTLQENAEHRRDINLIKKTLSGDKEAFSTLMCLYQNRVRALGMSFFHNQSDTDDFVQDVFLKAYTKLDSFRGESRFSTWLTRIAYTTAINSKNQRKEYETIADDSIIQDPSLSPEQAAIRRLTGLAVKEAMTELPEKYAICLDLYFFHDLSHDEISIITDFPVNTIKSHIFRAKKILHEKLKDFYADA